MRVYAVIMAGGGGTRFWPLSREEMPKQLLNISGRKLMINETIDRITDVISQDDIFIVTGASQMEAMSRAVSDRVRPDHILPEPVGRNTAACIGFSAMELLKKYGDGIMCVFPSDHFIRDERAFCDVIRSACAVAEKEDTLVTLGIKPTYPATGYGYIRYDRDDGFLAHRVLAFHEKPDRALAEEYIKSGSFLWNSGMFVWKASVILATMRELLPEVYEPVERIGMALGTPKERQVIEELYSDIPSVSIDYGIMEKASDVRVLSADMGWSDVGSWESLGEVYESDEEGNIFAGDHLAIDTRDCITYSGKRLIATLGVSDLIIVETDDAVLVCDKSRAQEVRRMTEELKKMGREELL